MDGQPAMDDVFGWTTEVRRAFVTAQGVENAETLDDDSLLALILSFIDTEAALPVPPPAAASAAAAEEDEGAGVWRAAEGEANTRAGGPIRVPVTNAPPPPVAHADAPPPHADADADAPDFDQDEDGAGAGEEGLEAGLKAVLDQFCDMTGSSRVEARNLLEALGWDLDSAVAIFMENVPDTGPAARPGAGANAPFRPHLTDINGPPPMAGTAAGAGAGPGAGAGAGAGAWNNNAGAYERDYPQLGGQGHRGGWGGDDDDDDEDGMGGPRVDRFDEFGVRLPDQVRTQRLMDGSPRGMGMGMGMGGDSQARAEEPGIEWMFPPPRHLSFPGTYKDARELARLEKKWLLVNLQTHQEFSSHMLNSDTWSSDTVESLLRSSFVFWQRGSTSGDGRDYMRLHALEEGALPHIAIIDARTGSKVHVLKVRRPTPPSPSSPLLSSPLALLCSSHFLNFFCCCV